MMFVKKKPPLTVVESCGSLPTGSVILDKDGDAWQCGIGGLWSCVTGERTWGDDVDRYAPFTVLWRGGTPGGDE